EARGDWAGLADVLSRQLRMSPDADTRVSLNMRLGELYEHKLSRPADALEHYKRAFEEGASRKVYEALERFLGETHPPERRVEVPALFLRKYEDADAAANVAGALKFLRVAAAAAERADYDRRLLRLYSRRLGRPGDAFAAGLAVFEHDPFDEANRIELHRLA